MLDFKKLELEEIPLIKSYLDNVSTKICDITIGGIFIWRDLFDVHYAIYNDILFFKVRYIRNEVAFTKPIGGDFFSAIDIILNYCQSNDLPLILCTMTNELLNELKEKYNIINITYERDWYDYLYLSDDLISLKGKKYSAVRNNINKFKGTYSNYKLVDINDTNIASLIDFYLSIGNFNDSNIKVYEDSHKTLEVLNYYKLYDFIGSILYVDNIIVGFSIGEIVDNVFFNHIEKANTNYVGVYQVLVNEVTKRYCQNIMYINREDDSGEIGIRFSKLKYRPIELLEKITIEIS